MTRKIAFIGRVNEYLAKYKFVLFFSTLLFIGVGTWIGLSFKEKHGKERKEITEALAEIQYLTEKKRYDESLEGKPGIYPGLESLNKQFIRDKALRNLVNLYIAIIYKEKKNYEEALTCLKCIQMSDFFMQARVKCLEGDVHCEMANYDEALACYLEAARFKPNEYFTPKYLIKAAQIYEKQKKYDKSIECYQMIIDKYPNYRQYIYIEKQLARVMCLKHKQ